jgi:sulfur carrier protein
MSGPSTMTVQVNGKGREVPRGITVLGLLESLELNPSLVVVEHNREILDRGSYGETPVEEKDVLELVHFVGGG